MTTLAPVQPRCVARSDEEDRSDRVAVIGAGSSGLAMLKNLRDAGLRADCLEREADFGGNWNIGLATSRVCESTHLISSKSQTEYLDHPMPGEWPEYVSHRQALEYFRGYADRFGLRDSIEFGAAVARVEPLGDGVRQRGWRVTLADGRRRRYAALAIANGHNHAMAFPDWSARSPRFEGESPFGGEELHAGEYRTPDRLAGRCVLVIGGGNSGCDIAAESAQHAAATRLSLRRGYHFLPKFYRGKPIDWIGERLLRWRVPLAVRRVLAKAAVYVILGPREGTGLPAPDHRLFETHPTINSQLVYRLRHGQIEVRPDVERLTAEGVRYVDGREEPFDVIVHATGYRLSIPFIDPALLAWRDGKPNLHLNVFAPGRDDLFVLGLIQPDSGQWGLVDRQARLVTRYLLARDSGTNAARRFRAEIDREPTRRPRHAERYVDSPRHLLEVEHFSYARRLDRAWRRLGKGLRAPARVAVGEPTTAITAAR
ncbi:MAG: NAD(P)-binding domain-containing protein [Planctomycetota bacterium]